MSAGSERLSSSALLSVASALSRGALSDGCRSRDQLQRLLSVEDADAIGRLLTELKNARMDGEQAAVTLRLLADSRKGQESSSRNWCGLTWTFEGIAMVSQWWPMSCFAVLRDTC